MTLSDILSMDDMIDSMSDSQVSHAMACSTFMFQIGRARGHGFQLTPAHAQVEGLLQDGQIKAAAEIGLERGAPARSEIMDADNPTEYLIDLLFKGEPSPEAFRNSLKEKVKGCGMADIIVARERIYDAVGDSA
jgi:hypothetical protein